MTRSHLSFEDMRRLSAELFERHSAQSIPETTPSAITPALLAFASSSLGGLPLVEVPVVPDRQYGLYCWCFDGVLQKVKHDGGGVRLGWVIWEWPNAFLNAEFHAVWIEPAGQLVDITPKPLGETRILFAPDPSYPHVSELAQRPRNRRVRIYVAVNDPSEIARHIAGMTPGQADYQRRRAAKVGMTLEQWLAAKLPEDVWAKAIDESIAACAEFERKLDEFPAGVSIRDTELEQLCDRREAAARNLETLWRRRQNSGPSSR